MGEKQGTRETIDRMTKHLVQEGRMEPSKAAEIARQAAIRDERKK